MKAVVHIDDRGRATSADDYIGRIAAAIEGVPAQVEYRRLVIGDVAWFGRGEVYHLVEIKRATDLVRSLISDHIQSQVTRMLAMPGEKYLVKLGRIAKGPRGETWTLTAEHAQDFPNYGRQSQREWARTETTEWTRHEVAFTAVTNYLMRMQLLGVKVVCADSLVDDGAVIAGLVKNSLKTKHAVQVPA